MGPLSDWAKPRPFKVQKGDLHLSTGPLANVDRPRFGGWGIRAAVTMMLECRPHSALLCHLSFSAVLSSSLFFFLQIVTKAAWLSFSWLIRACAMKQKSLFQWEIALLQVDLSTLILCWAAHKLHQNIVQCAFAQYKSCIVAECIVSAGCRVPSPGSRH